MPTALIVGASRGLGAALADGFAARKWTTIGTVRTAPADPPVEVEVELLDVVQSASIDALRGRLAGRTIDVLFVNAGTGIDMSTPIGAVTDDQFVDVMTVNALGPLRVIERLKDLVPPDGLIGAMTSGQGSITNNTGSANDLYRASKAALNMLMKSFAVRPEESRRSCLLLAPGWIRTDLGGSRAPYSVEESIPLLIDVIRAKRGRPGLEYLDRNGATVPW